MVYTHKPTATEKPASFSAEVAQQDPSKKAMRGLSYEAGNARLQMQRTDSSNEEMFDASKHMAAMGEDHKAAGDDEMLNPSKHMAAMAAGGAAAAGDNEMFDAKQHMAAMAGERAPAAGDNEMFDAKQHMAAMAGDEATSAGDEEMFDPSMHAAAVAEFSKKTKMDALKKSIETDRIQQIEARRVLADAQTALDAKIAATPATDLEAKKKLAAEKADVDKRFATAEKKLGQAAKDLELLENPGAQPSQLNDMMARRENVIAQPETSGTTSKVTVDEKQVARETVDESNKINADGASESNKQTSKTALAIDLKSASRSTSSETSAVKGATTDVKTESASHSVDLAKGQFTASNTTSQATKNSEDPTKSTSTSETKATSIGADGIGHSQERVVSKGENKTTESGSVKVTRGDGKLGVATSGSQKQENEDKSGHSSSHQTERGLIAGKDGVGAYAKRENTAEKKFANGLSVSGKASAGGTCVYNIEPIAGKSPPMYRVTGKLSLEASLGGGAGKEHENEANKSKASGSVSVGLTKTIERSFSRELTEDEARKWEAQMATVGSGSRELLILTLGVPTLGDLSQAENMKPGERRGIVDETKGEVKGEASGSSGPISAGAGLGYESGRKFEGEISRDKDSTSFALKTTDPKAVSGNVKGGFGVASMTLGGKSSTVKGGGYTFKVPDDYPDAANVRARAARLRTLEEMQAFAKEHPKLVAGKTEISGGGKDVTTGLAAGPAGADMTSGGSSSTEHSEEYDKDGNVIGTSDKMTGESHIGGKWNLGPVSGASNSTEKLETTVKSKKNEKGEMEQSASGDFSDTDTESGIDVKGSFKALAELADKPVGAATGDTKILKEKTTTNVAGFFLEDGDYEAIIAKANDPAAWSKGFSRAGNMEDWAICGREIRAAKGDKVLVAEALKKFAAGGDHGRMKNVAELLGVEQGKAGERYELPDGIGDKKGDYETLIVNNPMADVEALASENRYADAAAKAEMLADNVVKLESAIREKKDEFSDVNTYGVMMSKIGKRQVELRNKSRELKAKAAGKELSPEMLDRSSAAEKFNTLTDLCRDFSHQEQRIFEQIGANTEGMSSVSKTAENVKLVNQLRANAKLWETDYQEMIKLADTHGFTMGGQPFRTWKPDRLRLEMAYKGQNPNTAEAREAQDQANAHEKMAAEQNSEIATRTLSQMGSTAGMSRTSSGGYYREYSDEEKKQAEAKQFLELQPRVQADFASREASMLAAKAIAQGAMGKCNKLTSSGGWDNVPKGAKQPYSDGYRFFSEAQKAWQAAVSARDGKDLTVLKQYFPKAQSAISLFKDAESSFKKGDALM